MIINPPGAPSPSFNALKPLPALLQPTSSSPPCHLCSAMCCRYFALQIDTPEEEQDFDSIKWYLIHHDTWVWVDDDEWYVQVDRPCKHLQLDNRCGIYESRPQICREYGLPENLDSPDDPLCDYFSQEITHDHEFRTIAEIDTYVVKWRRQRARLRRKRSEAAKRAWAKRRSAAKQGGRKS
jgi:Fe-S-cluster containining protein